MNVEKLINNIEGIKDNTKSGYIYKYNSYVKNYGIDVYDSEANILKQLKARLNKQEKINRIIDAIKIIIIVRKKTKLPFEELGLFRLELNKKVDKNGTDTNERNIKLGILPTKQQIVEFIHEKSEDKNFKACLINTILLHFGVRNKDLDLTITKVNKKYEEGNYLIVLDDERFRYIRNDYKTVAKHGKKDNTFKSKAIVYYCEKLLNGKEETKLLTTTNKNQEILKSTMKFKDENGKWQHLGEGRMFKAILMNSSVEDIKRLYKSRGTEPNNIFTYYIN